MDLEDIRVSEISQSILFICKKNKNKNTDTEKRWMIARGRGWGMGKMGEGGQKVQTSSHVQHSNYR